MRLEHMRQADWLEEERAAAYDLLESTLSEEDLERLGRIRHEINHNILWKKVVPKAFSAMLVSLESVIFEGGEGVSRQGHAPFQQLFPVEQEFLGGKGTLRRNYMVLQLMKKVLGALKTRTNQAISDIPTIDLEKEEEVREFILDAERELCFEPTQKNPDEEEMDLVASLDGEDREPGQGFQCPGSHPEEAESSMGEIHINADVSRPESSTNCRHTSTVTTYYDSDGGRYAREYCRHCRRVIRKALMSLSGKTIVGRKPDPEKCEHRQVLWIEGKEGEEAYCTGCDLSPVPNPEKYNWEYAGLEPFGDNPAQDEVSSLDEVIACES